jgi:hypothetical protein
VLWDGSAYQNGGGDYLPASPLVYIPSTPSAFSVSSNQKVFFSPGNLQYNPNSTGAASGPYTRAWRFAENQWDTIGSDNVTFVYGAFNYNGWLDIFCWGTWTGLYPDPTRNYTNNNDYGWGNEDFPEESLLTDAALRDKDWRTLSQTEWTYLFNTRSTTSGVRFAKAKVSNVNGVILLPDDWSTSYHSLASTNTAEAAYTANEISAAAWMIDFEAHGAVFLPVTACRSWYGDFSFDNEYGYYWSSTKLSDNWDNTQAYCVSFRSGGLSPDYGHYYATAISVRLVNDIIVNNLNDYNQNDPKNW